MRYFKFDEMVLEISETNKKISISNDTPQINFLKSHKSDIEKEMGAVKALCSYLKKSDYIVNSVWDIMAGCGFSVKIFEKYLNPTNMVVNDMDQLCVDQLERNIKDKRKIITSYDFFKFPFNKFPIPDLTFIDFNNFTLRRIDQWDAALKKVESPLLVLADSACYGFKFGNLKKYNCESAIEYYEALSSEMNKRYGYGAEIIFPFGNACEVLLVRGRTFKNIKCENSEPIRIKIQTHDSEGFGLC